MTVEIQVTSLDNAPVQPSPSRLISMCVLMLVSMHAEPLLFTAKYATVSLRMVALSPTNNELTWWGAQHDKVALESWENCSREMQAHDETGWHRETRLWTCAFWAADCQATAMNLAVLISSNDCQHHCPS
jgi:hypothetical protein